MPRERFMPDGTQGTVENPPVGGGVAVATPEQQISIARRMAEQFVNYDTVLNRAADEQQMPPETRAAFLQNARPSFLQAVMPELAGAQPVTGIPRQQEQNITPPNREQQVMNQIDQQMAHLRAQGATEDQLQESYNRMIEQAQDAGLLIGTGGRLRTDQAASVEGESDEEFELVTIQTELGDRDHKVPKMIEHKVRDVRKALALMEQSVEGEGTAGIQQASKIAQTIIAGIQDPRYRDRNPILKLGTNERDMEAEQIREDLHTRLYKEYAARSYLNQAYVAYEKAEVIEGVKGAVSAMRYEWMNTLFRDVPELKYLLQFYVKNGVDFTEKGDSQKKNAFRERALAYASNAEKAEKMRSDATAKLYGNEEDRAKLYDGKQVDSKVLEYKADDLIWAQNLAERMWQMTGRRASQDPTVGDWSENLVDFGDDPQGGNLAIRKVLAWKRWLLTRKESERPHLELTEGIDLDENDFVTQIANKVLDQRRDEIVKAIEKLNPAAVEAIKAGFKTEKDRASNEKIIAEAETKYSELFAAMALNDKYKHLVKRDQETQKYVGDTSAVEDVTYEGQQIETDHIGKKGPYKIKNANGEIVETKNYVFDSSIKAKSVNFEEVDWDNFDFRIFGTNPMAYWAYRNIENPDKARDALIKGDETFLRHPNPATLKTAASAMDYLSAKRWAMKVTLANRYFEFLQTDKAEEALQTKIPEYKFSIGGPEIKTKSADKPNKMSIFKPHKWKEELKKMDISFDMPNIKGPFSDGPHMLHEAIIAQSRELKLNEKEYLELMENAFGKQPWREFQLLASYLRPDEFLFSFLMEIFKKVAESVGKDLKI